MMKSFVKIFLVLATASLASTAVAGQPNRGYFEFIFGNINSNGIRAQQYCGEYPRGFGDIIGVKGVQGQAYIKGYIANKYVNEVEIYDGLVSCPHSVNVLKGGANQSVTISLNGIVVTANCTDQVRQIRNQTGKTRFPDQRKPQVGSAIEKLHYTPDPYNGTCLVTATHPDGGKETYSDFARAYALDSSGN